MKYPRWETDPPKTFRLLAGGLGLLLAMEMLRLWSDLAKLYGPEGLLDPVLQQQQSLWQAVSMQHLVTQLAQYGEPPLPWVQVFALLYTLLAGLLCCTRYTRSSASLLLALHYSFFLANYTWSYGVDYLAQSGLWYCALFGGHTGEGRQRTGLQLLRWHLSLVYVFGGLGKLTGESWRNGEALWKAVQQPLSEYVISIPLSWHRFENLWLLGGWSVLLLELLYPLCLLRCRVRWPLVCCTVLMHMGIALVLGLYHFAALMIWYNSCAWYPTENKKQTKRCASINPLGGVGRDQARPIAADTAPILGKEVNDIY